MHTPLTSSPSSSTLQRDAVFATNSLSKLQARKLIPTCYKEFKHIHRFFDKNLKKSVVKLLPGDYYITEHDELITTVLGSCISVCAYDPVAKLGGMNHFMLPQQGKHGSNWETTTANSSTRFGNFAMEQLINALLTRGCTKKNLVFKIFGGGNILHESQMNVGERNIEFARSYIKSEGFKIAKEDVGDVCPRKVHFHPIEGRVQVKKLAKIESTTIEALESAYDQKLKQEETSHGNVELF